MQGFEETNLPDSFFDAAVGNVPFGQFKVPDKRYDKHNFLIHDYFFARTLDKVRPGGVVAFISSKGTMDKENPAVRKYIAQRADLLGAIRLPNDTFKAAAGTEVTSDIIFLQKRDRLIDIEPEWECTVWSLHVSLMTEQISESFFRMQSKISTRKSPNMKLTILNRRMKTSLSLLTPMFAISVSQLWTVRFITVKTAV